MNVLVTFLVPSETASRPVAMFSPRTWLKRHPNSRNFIATPSRTSILLGTLLHFTPIQTTRGCKTDIYPACNAHYAYKPSPTPGAHTVEGARSIEGINGHLVKYIYCEYII